MGIPEKISREVSPDPGGKPRTELISGAGSEAGRRGWRGRGGMSQDGVGDKVFLKAPFSSALHTP